MLHDLWQGKHYHKGNPLPTDNTGCLVRKKQGHGGIGKLEFDSPARVGFRSSSGEVRIRVPTFFCSLFSRGKRALLGDLGNQESA